MRLGNFVSMRESDSASNRFVAGQSSIYHYAQLGSSLSVRASVPSGLACSILRFTHVGSTVSLRSFYRSNGAVSSVDFVNVGSNISIRSFVRVGSTLSAYGSSVLRVGTGYIFCDSGDNDRIKFYAAKASESSSSFSHTSMTLTTGQGKLHGTWTYETALTSDRRLKKDVEPLVKDILKYSKNTASFHESSQYLHSDVTQHNIASYTQNKKLKGEQLAVTTPQSVDQDNLCETYCVSKSYKERTTYYQDMLPAVLKLLRQLRPVSFKYKNNGESKHSRYGFIAQELEVLIPSLIYGDAKSSLKFIRYHDLLAVLTMGVQGLDFEIRTVQKRMGKLNKVISSDFSGMNIRINMLENALIKILKSDIPVDAIDQDNYSVGISHDQNHAYRADESGALFRNRSVNYQLHTIETSTNSTKVEMQSKTFRVETLSSFDLRSLEAQSAVSLVNETVNVTRSLKLTGKGADDVKINQLSHHKNDDEGDELINELHALSKK